MNIFKKIFLKNNEKIDEKNLHKIFIDQYLEIGKLVREARIKKNISVKELSTISRIPKYIINSIENNIENTRPKYPFIRSILSKLEECLSLEKNILVDLSINGKKAPKKDKEKFVFNKFDFINTWQGSVLYFLILIFSIFLLKRYFISNVRIIEIQNIEEKINSK